MSIVLLPIFHLIIVNPCIGSLELAFILNNKSPFMMKLCFEVDIFWILIPWYLLFFRYLSMKIVMQYDTPTSRTDKCISRLFTLYKEFISARSYEHQSHCSNFRHTQQNIWHKYSLCIIHVRDNPSRLN